MWSQWNGRGLQHLRLTYREDEVIADGIILGTENDAAFRLRYEVRCDSQWSVRKVSVDTLNGVEAVSLMTDGKGHWSDASGKTIQMLEGCLDIDISATPFTNTLPIHRLALKPEESSDLNVAYIAIPQMQISASRQRYTCLARGITGGKYKYESLESEFTADLTVDADGLVEDYPGLFRRVWSS